VNGHDDDDNDDDDEVKEYDNNDDDDGLVIALRPQTPKHIRGSWSHYTDTSEPVDGGVGTLQL
jgi:hypothetical protein